MRQKLSRREFMAVSSAAAGTVTFGSSAFPLSAQPQAGGFKGSLCFFSKHLATMDWKRLARSVRQAGFDGVDLTVRKRGHVLPENAAADLPQAVAAIREQDIQVPMITTELLSAGDPTARRILVTAGKLSIPMFKPGYYKYDFKDIRRELERAGNEFRKLADLGKQCGVQVGYHNHAGYLGAPVWDIASVMESLDPKWAGYYFDVRHAVVEGGDAGWRIAAKLVAERLKMIAVKDFYWDKVAGQGWQQINCPLGQGMVNWKAYFRELAGAGFHGPVSLHIEYPVPGTTDAVIEENTLAAAVRDLQFLRSGLREAYATARPATSV
ncbi:MAG TPA: sugar phosphate isomerase/epimerase family protein [Acidobacteriota bacterium]|jgi:sugar phosphate isomerase/epimerase